MWWSSFRNEWRVSGLTICPTNTSLSLPILKPECLEALRLRTGKCILVLIFIGFETACCQYNLVLILLELRVVNTHRRCNTPSCGRLPNIHDSIEPKILPLFYDDSACLTSKFLTTQISLPVTISMRTWSYHELSETNDLIGLVTRTAAKYSRIYARMRERIICIFGPDDGNARTHHCKLKSRTAGWKVEWEAESHMIERFWDIIP